MGMGMGAVSGAGVTQPPAVSTGRDVGGAVAGAGAGTSIASPRTPGSTTSKSSGQYRDRSIRRLSMALMDHLPALCTLRASFGQANRTSSEASELETLLEDMEEAMSLAQRLVDADYVLPPDAVPKLTAVLPSNSSDSSSEEDEEEDDDSEESEAGAATASGPGSAVRMSKAEKDALIQEMAALGERISSLLEAPSVAAAVPSPAQLLRRRSSLSAWLAAAVASPSPTSDPKPSSPSPVGAAGSVGGRRSTTLRRAVSAPWGSIGSPPTTPGAPDSGAPDRGAPDNGAPASVPTTLAAAAPLDAAGAGSGGGTPRAARSSGASVHSASSPPYVVSSDSHSDSDNDSGSDTGHAPGVGVSSDDDEEDVRRKLAVMYGSLGSDGQLELREPSPQALHRGSVRHVLSTYEAMLEAVNRMRRRKREMSVEGQLVEAKGVPIQGKTTLVMRYERTRAVNILMQPSSIFADLGRADAQEIVDQCDLRVYKPGENVCVEGGRSSEMYIIVEGEVSVTVLGREIIRRYVGQFFGEFALLSDAPRSATVTAVVLCKLVVLPRSVYDGVVLRNPHSSLARLFDGILKK